MSGKNKKVRRKSGFLTGLVIVSTGLIAGFHGFDLAVNDQSSVVNDRARANTPQGERSPYAVASQVNALDQLITASLKQGDLRNNALDNDTTGLSNLIRSSSKDLPVVNRALKRDRVIRQQTLDVSADNESVFGEAASFMHVAPPAKVKRKIRPVIAPPAALVKASLHIDVPFADSADIALFAADMPLPDKLLKGAKRDGASLISRSVRSPFNNGSPLVPRKLVSGKAFGGLAERAFQKRERRCMTTALYFEARSEPEAGQIAVGQVVMNRVKSPDYPDTICGVVYQGSHRRTGCQFSFTCDGKADKPNSKSQWERSKRLANRVLDGKAWLKSIDDATHYHANYVKPRWRRKMSRLKQIGRHIFYKSPNISVTETYQRYISGKRS